MIMISSWLHALLGIIHKAETKSSCKKQNKTHTYTHTHTQVCENKETDSPSDSPSGIYRMKLLGICSLLKGSHEKNGTPIFWEWDSYFLAGTPTFYKKGVPDSYF